MISLLETPGFLGTNASLLSDLSLLLCLISLVLFIVGGLQAKRRQFKSHCPTQTVALILVILAVVLFMAPVYTEQYESTNAGLSPFLPNGLVALHAGLGGLTLLYGVYVTLVGYRVFKSKHKKLLMQIASILFIILNVSGIVIYLSLYL
mgnify:CR=1 FL=1